jgi:CRISPR-associated endonuclease Csn1
MTVSFGLDVGSNSLGSAWIDHQTGEITVGLSIFPAGVDESDEKRGDPKNAKRRATRRARITLARRALRKRLLRQKLISVGLLPSSVDEFKTLLQDTDPWELRRKGLTEPLTPFQFGRVLLHLAQRRGALGFDADVGDKGAVKEAIAGLKKSLIEKFGSEQDRQAKHSLDQIIETLSKKKNRTDQEGDELDKAQEQLSQLCKSVLQGAQVTYGRFIADLRDERRTAITTEDRRKSPKGPREWRKPIRNRAGKFEFHADRAMIRDEFAKLWNAQQRLGGPLAEKLTDELRKTLDDESGDADWRHKGLLFGQRRQSWDMGTLGRCVLEPTERCVPHADMYASRYLVVETVNNLKVIERGRLPRSLTPNERAKIKTFLSGPLGVVAKGKQKGQAKRTVTVSDLRELMGWGPATKTSQFHFNIESDEERQINTDWFSREIIHGAITREKWEQLPERSREGINRVILKYDPDDEKHADKLKTLVMQPWAGLSEEQADKLVAAWKKRPRPDAKRLNMSRRAVRNLLAVMDRDEPWPDPKHPGQTRWLTQIEARKQIAADPNFRDVTTDQPLDQITRRRYATGTKGATARDRHYIKKHLLKKNKELIYGPDGLPLHEPPPAPLISNPVVRKAIHEVRRHIVEFLTTFGRKPDEIHVELAREARMGKVDADKLLFKNRLRNRIRRDIINEFNLSACSSTQQRAAVDRVVLAAQQGCVCPLCGQTTRDGSGITLRTAALGQDCEVAHIIPRGSGGHNGLGNLVLAHRECNRDMARRTPRQFWDAELPGGFAEGISRIEKIFGDIQRPKMSDLKDATGDALWLCYFNKRDDLLKIEQFKKDVKDIQEMTQRQEAATKYAARQVMAYLADALFEGKGLPERSTGTEENPEKRLIFATDGLWTSRLRREWGLFFDFHGGQAHGLTNEQESERKEKNRGDHRHHAIDAIVIALCTEQVRKAWDARELQADKDGINTADEDEMEKYREQHRLDPPAPFKNRQHLREAVQRAVFGNGPLERPVAHRPVKRKLIGALHEETLFGPVVDRGGNLTENYTAKKSVLQLDPNHLRMPRPETEQEAIERLTLRRLKEKLVDEKTARKWAKTVVASPGFTPKLVDPPPGKSGIVRDVALRKRIRDCLSGFQYVKRNKNGEPIGEAHFVNPDDFTEHELKQAIDAGAICQASGVPIHSVVLLRTMSGPVVIDRKRPDYASGRMIRDNDPASKRAYVGGNNHHIEIRVTKNKKGVETWSGEIVTAFEAAQRKLARLRAFRDAGIPKLKVLRKLPKAERAKFKTELRRIETTHPVVDRSDNDIKGGKFVMSLCEGEMLMMKHKHTGEVGYFVVAKLDKPQSIVVVPHWDARAATERKDSYGRKVPNSKREQFAVTPADLKGLAPPGHDHAIKVRVSPLGEVVEVKD